MDTTGAPSPRSEPSLRFWDWGEVRTYLIAKRTQDLDNLYGQQNVAGKTAKPKSRENLQV